MLPEEINALCQTLDVALAEGDIKCSAAIGRGLSGTPGEKICIGRACGFSNGYLLHRAEV